MEVVARHESIYTYLFCSPDATKTPKKSAPSAKGNSANALPRVMLPPNSRLALRDSCSRSPPASTSAPPAGRAARHRSVGRESRPGDAQVANLRQLQRAALGQSCRRSAPHTPHTGGYAAAPARPAPWRSTACTRPEHGTRPTFAAPTRATPQPALPWACSLLLDAVSLPLPLPPPLCALVSDLSVTALCYEAASSRWGCKGLNGQRGSRARNSKSCPTLLRRPEEESPHVAPSPALSHTPCRGGVLAMGARNPDVAAGLGGAPRARVARHHTRGNCPKKYSARHRHVPLSALAAVRCSAAHSIAPTPTVQIMCFYNYSLCLRLPFTAIRRQ